MAAALIKYVVDQSSAQILTRCRSASIEVELICWFYFRRQFTQAPKNKYFDVSSIRAVNKDLVMRKSAFVFNETKVTDHHALLPTLNSDWQELASKLDEKELVVFIAITKRFLSTIRF
jgi:DNA topoisomerase IA